MRHQPAMPTVAYSTAGAFSISGGYRGCTVVAALYAPDATVLPTMEPIWQGEVGKKYWIDVTNGFTGPTEMTTTAVEGRGDLAYAVGTYRGAKPPTEEGKYLEVLKKQADGLWKIVYDMWSSNAPLGKR